MKVTGRLQAHRGTSQDGTKSDFLATKSGDEIERQARVEKLRQLVASGRYQVSPDVLAEKILRSALIKGHE